MWIIKLGKTFFMITKIASIMLYFLDFKEGPTTIKLQPLQLQCRKQPNLLLGKGPFNNYVDKMRGEGSKNVCFCPPSGYKNGHTYVFVLLRSIFRC